MSIRLSGERADSGAPSFWVSRWCRLFGIVCLPARIDFRQIIRQPPSFREWQLPAVPGAIPCECRNIRCHRLPNVRTRDLKLIDHKDSMYSLRPCSLVEVPHPPFGFVRFPANLRRFDSTIGCSIARLDLIRLRVCTHGNAQHEYRQCRLHSFLCRTSRLSGQPDRGAPRASHEA